MLVIRHNQHLVSTPVPTNRKKQNNIGSSAGEPYSIIKFRIRLSTLKLFL